MTEFQIQMAVVDYLESLAAQGHQVKFTSIPNSTYTTSWSQKAKNKQSGLRPGLPDMFIIINNQPFFLELKTQKNSRFSEAQKEWIKAIDATRKLKAHGCKGLDSAISIINSYLPT